MRLVKDIYEKLITLAPEDLAEDWDQVGPQIYFPEEEVSGLVISLDVTDQVIKKCLEENCNVIISHHPMFFQGIHGIDLRDYKSKIIYQALKNKISILSAHTNLDRARGGVNDALAKELKLTDLKALDLDDQGRTMGYIGKIETKDLKDLLDALNTFVTTRPPIVYGRAPKKINRVAILGGSGAEFMDQAIQGGADLFITGDVKYHDGQGAYERDFCLIDIGHYDSEKLVLKPLQDLYKEEKTVVYKKCDFIL